MGIFRSSKPLLCNLTENSQSRKVNLRRTDGTVQSVQMTVTGVRSGIQGRDAVIRIDF